MGDSRGTVDWIAFGCGADSRSPFMRRCPSSSARHRLWRQGAEHLLDGLRRTQQSNTSNYSLIGTSMSLTLIPKSPDNHGILCLLTDFRAKISNKSIDIWRVSWLSRQFWAKIRKLLDIWRVL